MGIGGDAFAIHLAAETEQLVLAQAPLQERARIDARRRMALEVHQVTTMPFVRGTPEVVKANAE